MIFQAGGAGCDGDRAGADATRLSFCAVDVGVAAGEAMSAAEMLDA